MRQSNGIFIPTTTRDYERARDSDWLDPQTTEAETLPTDPLDMIDLLTRIQDALGTAETGDALVEVARNAHRAERTLAAFTIRAENAVPDELGEIVNTLLGSRTFEA